MTCALKKTKKMDGTMIFTLLIVSCFSVTEGQANAEFKYVESCYSVGQTLTLEALYTGSGIPGIVQWSYSGGTGTNLLITTSTCTPFGDVPAGYPSATRMAYQCPLTDSLPTNKYRLTVTGLTSNETTDSWGATFTPPSGTAPAAVKEAIPECTTTDEDKNKCDTKCKNDVGGGVGGSVGGVGGVCICIGVAVWLKKKKKVWIVVIPNDGTWQEETCHVGPSNGANCVQEVRRGGPADKKLKKGDRILSINGKSTTGKSIENINKQLKIPPTVLELTIKRGEDKKHVTLDFKGKASSGIAIKKEKEDIVVSTIEPGSAAAISGEIQEKDCILSVNGVSTAGLKVADIKKMLTFSIILKVTKDVTVLELDLYLNGSIGVKNASANTVISVKAKGPATFAGIQEWDEILEIDGQSTDTMTVKQIAEMISSRGKTVRFKIARGEVTVERDEFGSLGLELSSTPNVVNKVYGNAALSQKVKVGDEILEIDGQSTDTMTVDQIAEMISSRGKTVRFKIARGEVTVERDTNGSLGLELSSTPNVVYKVDGNAALSQKVKAGDMIVSINGKKTKGKNHHEIKTMLESSGDSISLKIEEAVNENGKPHRTSRHGEHGARTNDIEMGNVNSRAQDSGRVQTLETTEEKQDFMKPLLDDKC